MHLLPLLASLAGLYSHSYFGSPKIIPGARIWPFGRFKDIAVLAFQRFKDIAIWTFQRFFKDIAVRAFQRFFASADVSSVDARVSALMNDLL